MIRGDDNAIIESKTTIAAATQKHGVAFQHPQSRCRLARGNNLRSSSSHCAHKLISDGSHRRQSLQQRKRDALTGEQDIGEARRGRSPSRFYLFPISHEGFQLLL